MRIFIIAICLLVLALVVEDASAQWRGGRGRGGRGRGRGRGRPCQVTVDGNSIPCDGCPQGTTCQAPGASFVNNGKSIVFGGMCKSQSCEPSGANSCPSGYICLSRGSSGKCKKSCNTNNDCSGGSECTEVDGQKICLPPRRRGQRPEQATCTTTCAEVNGVAHSCYCGKCFPTCKAMISEAACGTSDCSADTNECLQQRGRRGRGRRSVVDLFNLDELEYFSDNFA